MHLRRVYLCLLYMPYRIAEGNRHFLQATKALIFQLLLLCHLLNHLNNLGGLLLAPLQSVNIFVLGNPELDTTCRCGLPSAKIEWVTLFCFTVVCRLYHKCVLLMCSPPHLLGPPNPFLKSCPFCPRLACPQHLYVYVVGLSYLQDFSVGHVKPHRVLLPTSPACC